jgi:hypothetical protein
MLSNSKRISKFLLILPVIVVFVLAAGVGHTAKKKDKDQKTERTFVMTEAELQAQVMNFADRNTSIMASAFVAYDAESPPPKNRRLIRGTVVYSLSSAFTIAASSEPDAALLDMVVMITLGRMIFEEHWLKKMGSEVEPILAGFRKSEKDIWQIANKVFTPEQQKQLYAIIKEWRQNNQDVLVFSYIRYGDFMSERSTSRLDQEKKTGGLFKSVQVATQQVEEMRLLAERGMFLATRLPLLTGAFADLWLSQLTVNPDVKEILGDLHQFSEVSERLANVAEKLPDQIAKERDITIKQAMNNINDLMIATIDQAAKKVASERQATIIQFMEGLSEERQRAVQDFLAQEHLIRGLMTDLRQTLVSGNELVTSANTLAERLNLGPSEATSATSSEPFDIKDYQATMMEASNIILQLDNLIKTVDQLMLSPGWEQSIPRIIEAITAVEKKGTGWVNYGFLLGVALIVIFLLGAVLAMLTYRYSSQRMFGKNLQNGDFRKG